MLFCIAAAVFYFMYIHIHMPGNYHCVKTTETKRCHLNQTCEKHETITLAVPRLRKNVCLPCRSLY